MGYFPYEREFGTNVNGWYFGNLIFGPWALLGMLFIDPYTGVMWKLNEDTIDAKLYKSTPEGMVRMAQEKYNGIAALSERNFKLAIDDANMALTLNPEFIDAYYIRGAAYAGQGQLDKALDDLDKFIATKPDSPEGYKTRGNVYMAQDKLDMAFSDCNKALELKPGFGEALFCRGNVYEAQGMKSLAKIEFNLSCKQGFMKACNWPPSAIPSD